MHRRLAQDKYSHGNVMVRAILKYLLHRDVNHCLLPPNGLALHSWHTFNRALLSGSFMVVTARRLLHHSHFKWLAIKLGSPVRDTSTYW
jgi:hypothetical protein